MDTKKLRQKILDLAIHGKLVPQDPNDEPASVLLERIRAEKERLIAEGKIKRSKKSATSDTPHYENVPFELPEGWCWCRLDKLCDIKGGKRVPRGMSFSDVPTSHVYIRVTNMKKNTIIDNDLKYIDDEVFSYISNYTICKSDLYLTIAGTIGDVGEVPEEYDMMSLTENAAKLTNIICDRKYLMYSLLSSHAQEHFSSKFHQVAQPKLSIETASSTLVPIPPIEEQKRIAAEIGKYIDLIEIFEESKQELDSAISQTKAKILDLAIHGKLVPQDPNDEPASELLKRINPKAVSSCDNPQYGKIPSGWVWCKIEDIFKVVMGQSPNGDSVNHKFIGVEFHQGKLLFSQCIVEKSDVYTTSPTKLADKDSLLVCVRAPVGDVNITDREICIGRGLCALKPLSNLPLDYWFYAIKSLKTEFNKKATGSTFLAISALTIKNQVISLPPYQEQLRIVSKVKELFSLLDIIEKSLQA